MSSEAEYALFFLGLTMAPVGVILLGVALYRRSRRLALVGGICIAVFSLAVARVHSAQFWEIDACLDQGGGYNRVTGQCEYE